MNGNTFTKIACGLGYVIFAGFSTYFTSQSLSLNLLAGANVWIVYILVFIISILAGWCLTNAIEELENRINPSKTKLTLSIIGFLLFWTFSFTTNVHYFFVQKHGYSILVEELSSAKHYIVENTEQNNQNIDRVKNSAQDAITVAVMKYQEEFNRELANTIDGHAGFGDACITILKSIENTLSANSKNYDDQNEYQGTIFDDKRDAGDRGITQRSKFPALLTKYNTRIEEQLNKKLSVIDNYYNRQKNLNSELKEILNPINDLETGHLPALEKDGGVAAYYKYQGIQQARVIDKMPDDYKNGRIIKEGNKIIEFNPYPSKRMFDTMSVWGDLFKGLLKGMSMIQWIVISLIIDIVSFILFALFRRA